MTKNNNFMEEVKLDKPIKVKTLKKKLVDMRMKNPYKNYEKQIKNIKFNIVYEIPLQNNKSGDLLDYEFKFETPEIEKLECSLGCGLLTEEQRRNNAIERIESKINEIIDYINLHQKQHDMDKEDTEI